MRNPDTVRRTHPDTVRLGKAKGGRTHALSIESVSGRLSVEEERHVRACTPYMYGSHRHRLSDTPSFLTSQLGRDRASHAHNLSVGALIGAACADFPRLPVFLLGGQPTTEPVSREENGSSS